MKTLVNIFLKPIYKKILNIINISYVDHKYKRFGREGDGGYVLPINIIEQNLKENFAVLTFGVNDDISFEDQLKDYFENTNFFCFDPTISEPPKTKNNIYFDFNSMIHKISNKVIRVGFEKLTNKYSTFDVEFYESVNIPFSVRFDNFHIERDFELEQNIINTLARIVEIHTRGKRAETKISTQNNVGHI